MAFGSKALAKFLKKKGKEVLEDLTDKPTVKKATPSKAEESKVTGSTQEKPKGEKKKSGAGRKRKARGAELSGHYQQLNKRNGLEKQGSQVSLKQHRDRHVLQEKIENQNGLKKNNKEKWMQLCVRNKHLWVFAE